MKANGYCLKDPHGNLLAFTFGDTKDDCWSNSFEWLFGNFDWMRPYWKKVAASIRAAGKQGYRMVAVHLSEVEKGVCIYCDYCGKKILGKARTNRLQRLGDRDHAHHFCGHQCFIAWKK